MWSDISTCRYSLFSLKELDSQHLHKLPLKKKIWSWICFEATLISVPANLPPHPPAPESVDTLSVKSSLKG